MGQFSNSFPKHFSYLCEYAIRFDLSCSFCEYSFIFHCLHCSPSCFVPDSLLLAHLWLGLSWIYCISANKSFSSSKTSSRKPYTSSKQQERQKHSVETTINFSGSKRQAVSAHRQQPRAVHPVRRVQAHISRRARRWTQGRRTPTGRQRQRLRHRQGQHLGNLDLDLAALYLRSAYMGQWKWLRTRWMDSRRPSGPSQSKRWLWSLSL